VTISEKAITKTEIRAVEFLATLVALFKRSHAMPDEMLPDLAALLKRLEAIEKRQDRLEARLKDWASEKPERRLSKLTPVILTPSQPSLKSEVKVEEIPTVLPVDKAEIKEHAPPVSPPLERPRAARQRHHGFEQAIGLKWAGWIGAIVLAIGAGLGIKFAYEQGWLGHLPVEVRLFLMSLGGFALIGAGEVVYRRVDHISAAAVFGAGVTVLFLISYAGNTYYGAYSYQTAFIFALLTTIIGSAVAIRGRLVSIAVLSQIGGQLGPIILSTGQPPGVALLGYVLMLQMVALILALWGRSPKWWLLRAVSLSGTSWWVVIALAEGHWSAGLGNEVLWFSVVYAAAYQGELLRSGLLAGDKENQGVLVQGSGTIFSLLVTAGLTAVALHVFYDYDSAVLRGGSTLVLAACCLAGGFLLHGQDNKLVHSLATGYLIQGIALLLLFVPVTFASVWISLAWAVFALAFASIGARFDRDLARGAAVAAWLLAVGRWLFDVTQSGPTDPAGQTWVVLGGHPILAITGVAWLVSLAGLAIAWLLQTDLLRMNPRSQTTTSWQPLAVGTSVAASVVWGIASLENLPHLGATLALVFYAWLLFGVDFAPQELHLAPHAVIILLIAAMKWAGVDGLADRMSSDWNAEEYIPLVNPFMGMGVLLAASLAGMVWMKQAAFDRLLIQFSERSVSSAASFFALAVLVLTILTIGLSFEADRLIERAAAAGRQLGWSVESLRFFALTIIWELAVLILAFVGRRVGVQTFVPWVLFLVVAVKFLLVDMLFMRLVASQGPAHVTVIFNFQVLAAVLLLAGFFCLTHICPLPEPAALSGKSFVDVESSTDLFTLQIGIKDAVQILRVLTNLVALLILLLACTLEIDRAFAGPLASAFGDPRLAKEVAISIFWSLFAIATVLAGFRFWSVGLRLFGLSLFGITVIKVLLIDMREVRFGYRILSLLGLGLLLLATSVVYGKVGAKRLRQQD
jgi:uncharacterized membrane protein